MGDDYLPLWKVPSLKHYYTDLGFGMKDSFNAYIVSQGMYFPSDMSIQRLVWSRVKPVIFFTHCFFYR